MTTTARSEALLSDLLAVIHRDGGHHTSDVGLERSVADAIDRVLSLRQDNDEHQTTFELLERRLARLEGRRSAAKHTHTNKDAGRNLAG